VQKHSFKDGKGNCASRVQSIGCGMFCKVDTLQRVASSSFLMSSRLARAALKSFSVTLAENSYLTTRF
jgi:hypothetical protein